MGVHHHRRRLSGGRVSRNLNQNHLLGHRRRPAHQRLGQQPARRVLTALGVDLADYEAVHEDVNFYWERGLSTAQHFFKQTVFETNPSSPHLRAPLAPGLCRKQGPPPGVLRHPRHPQRTGQFSLATLNNESHELNEHRLDAFRLRPTSTTSSAPATSTR